MLVCEYFPRYPETTLFITMDSCKFIIQEQTLITLFLEKFSANKREIIFFFIGQILGVALNFAIIKLIAQAGAAVYGEYILIISLAAFTGQLFYGPFQQGFVRYFYEGGSTDRSSVYNQLISLLHATGAAAFATLAVLFAIVSWMADSQNYTGMIFLALLFALTSKFSEFFSGLMNVARKRVFNAVVQTAEKLVGVVLVFLLLRYSMLSTPYIIIALAFPLLIFGLIKAKHFGWWFNSGKINQIKNEKMTRELITYTLPFIIWGVAIWLQLNGEKWVINAFLTTEDVGYYGLMFALTNAFIALPSNILNDLFLPLIFKNFSETGGDRHRGEFYIRLNVLFTLILTIVSAVLFYFSGDYLITLLSNSTYTKYSNLLPFLAIGSGLFYAGQAMCSKGLAYNKPQLYLFPKVISGVLSVILYYYFIQFYGMTGIIAAIVLTGALYMIFVMIANRKLST